MSFYQNQSVVNPVSLSSIKDIFWHKNTSIISVSQLSHLPHSDKEVARSCTCSYGDTKDSLVVIDREYHLPRLRSYQYKIYHVSVYDILVPWIPCRMYLYVHKSWLNVRDELITSLGRLIHTSLAHCEVTKKLSYAWAGISRSQTQALGLYPACTRQSNM